MVAQPTAWGQTLRTAARMGHERREGFSDPVPKFFHQKQDAESSGQKHVLRSHDVDSRVQTLTHLKQRVLSPEFMRAITLSASEVQEQSFVPRQEMQSSAHEKQEFSLDEQQGVVFKMNKFSLITLILGLLFLGLMFFAGGLMLAFNFSDREIAAPVQAQSHDHSHTLAASRQLVTLLPPGAQSSVSQANQVASVAQTAAVPSASYAPASPPPQGTLQVAPVGGMPGAKANGTMIAPSHQLNPSGQLAASASVVSPPQVGPAVQVASPVPITAPTQVSSSPQGLSPAQMAPGASMMQPTPVAPSTPMVQPAQASPPAQMISPVQTIPPSQVAPPAPIVPPVQGQPQGMLDATTLTRPFSLQVGSYASLEGAQKVVDLLRRRGYSAYAVVIPLAHEGKGYAVRMGGYFTRQSAAVAAEHLMSKERFKMMSIRKNNAEKVIL